MLHQPPTISLARTRHRGMTFTEVMFAVIVLGIGFIMLAAIFPVAIQQTKTSVEQTQGAAMSLGALRYMEQLGTLTDNGTPPVSLLQPTDGGVPTTPAEVIAITNNPAADPTAKALFLAASGNMIRSDDPRYAFVPLYRRQTGSPFAQVFMFVSQIRNIDKHPGGIYNLNDVLRPAADPTAPAVLEPRELGVVFSKATPADPVDRITFTVVSNPPANNPVNAVGEGCYAIIAGGSTATSSYGYILRLGVPYTDNGAPPFTWQMAPGYELPAYFPASLTAKVYILGKSYKDSTDPTQGYSGLVQDVGCYTTFVRVN